MIRALHALLIGAACLPVYGILAFAHVVPWWN
jgi:hypothetical protein